ncbi:hypothetical protein FACS1894105_03530 [Clostridia bacterium]|nr:hypothetical protein FACS1894105_03530 [Clostridia bacterium]
MKRKIAGVTAAVLLCVNIAACSSQSGDKSDTTSSSGTVTSAETTTAMNADNLPELDFGGQTFTILSRDYSDGIIFGMEMGVEEENAEIVNDAIYRRNKSVENRLNVNINVIKMAGNFESGGNYIDTVKKSVASGENTYNLVGGYAYHFPPLAAAGNFANWRNMPYIDLDAPYWSADLADAMTLDGKLYVMTGDLSLSTLWNMSCVYFNKKLAYDLQITEDFYQLVLDGKWTWDKIAEISRGVYKDLNGDGVRDEGDLYGTVFTPGGTQIESAFVSIDQPVTARDSDGYPYLVMNSPKTIKFTEIIMEFTFENPGVFVNPRGYEEDIMASFIADRALFVPFRLTATDLLRTMDSDYGILPTPKFDEAQEKYLTMSHDWYSLLCVPATNTDFEFVSAVIEALASESYRTVTPTYFESALKVKYSRDEASSQMLDIIRDGMKFDFAFVNSSSMNNIMHIFRNLVSLKRKDFASIYEKSEKVYQTSLDKLIEAYKSLD